MRRETRGQRRRTGAAVFASACLLLRPEGAKDGGVWDRTRQLLQGCGSKSPAYAEIPSLLVGPCPILPTARSTETVPAPAPEPCDLGLLPMMQAGHDHGAVSFTRYQTPYLNWRRLALRTSSMIVGYWWGFWPMRVMVSLTRCRNWSPRPGSRASCHSRACWMSRAASAERRTGCVNGRTGAAGGAPARLPTDARPSRLHRRSPAVPG